jgi:hypothetical protein
MRMDQLVQLSTQEQLRLNETMKQPEMSGHGRMLYDADKDGFEDFLEGALGAGASHLISPDELEEWDDDVVVTGTSLLNILLLGSECEASQTLHVLVALPHGPRWFREADRLPAHYDPGDLSPRVPRPELPAGARWPTDDEADHITRLWHGRLEFDAYSRHDLEDVNCAIAVTHASVYATHCAISQDDFDFIRDANGHYPPTPLALLNVVLAVLCPGVMVGCFDGVLAWVIIENKWENTLRQRSLFINDLYVADLDSFSSDWFMDDDDEAWEEFDRRQPTGRDDVPF